MPAFINAEGVPVEIYRGLPFVDGGEIQRPSNWLEFATEDECIEAGVQAIVEPPEPPAGKAHVLTGLTVRDGLVARTYRVEDAPAPLPDPVPEDISDRQFAQVLALDGVITQDEALAWAARGDLPSRLTDALTHIPEAGGQRFGARMMLSAATVYKRHNPLVPVLGALLGLDASMLDSIWTRGEPL